MKKCWICFLLIICCSFLFSVDWPQEIQSKDQLISTFARSRGSFFTSGIIFENEGIVKASDSGVVLITIDESKSIDSFDSALGKTLVTLNKENLMSIYGNLEEIHITSTENTIKANKIIGTSGKTSWQQKECGLEYQVADIENHTLINPEILLPKFETKTTPVLRNITAINKNGIRYQLSNTHTLKPGTYSVYFDQNESFIPYKICVLLNGNEVETVTYNALKHRNNKLYIEAEKSYPFETIFPDSKKQLITTISLNRGKARLVIQAYDINGNEKTISYSIEVK